MVHTDFIHHFNRVVNQFDLTDGAVRLLELLLSYDLPDPRNGQQRKGFCWPSRSTLAEELGCSDRTLRRRLSELRAAGVIADLDASEVRQLRALGYDLPDAATSGWSICYDQFPMDVDEVGQRGGQNWPVPHGPPESGKEPDNTTPEYKDTAAPVDNGGDDKAPPIPEPEPEPEIHVQKLLKWKVSRPQAQRIATQVDTDIIDQAIHLLKRNQALPCDQRVIHNPGGWCNYVLQILDDPALEAWEARIAAAEDTITASPTSRTVTIPELVPQEAKPASLEPVEDDDPVEVAQIIKASFLEAEAQTAPTFDVTVGADGQSSTVTSIEAGKRQVELRYDRSPEALEGDIIIDERTMPDQEPHPEVAEKNGPVEDEDDPAANVGERHEVSLVQGERAPEHMSGHIGEVPSPQLDQADCEWVWQQVQDQLEEAGQWLPLLDKVVVQRHAHTVELWASSPAVAWSLINRQERIEEVIRDVTGQTGLTVEVHSQSP